MINAPGWRPKRPSLLLITFSIDSVVGGVDQLGTDRPKVQASASTHLPPLLNLAPPLSPRKQRVFRIGPEPSRARSGEANP